VLSKNFPRENHQFVGGSQIINQLNDHVNKSRTLPAEPVSCLLYGQAGIGKTQTAIRYGYTAQDKYRYIFWVTAATPELALQSFMEIGTVLNLSKPINNMDGGAVVSEVRAWLQDSGAYSVYATANVPIDH
jgi:hypothetical protein